VSFPASSGRTIRFPDARAVRAILAVALLVALPLQSGAQNVPAVRVLELTGDGASEGAYALAGGFFKKYGLDATVSAGTGGGAAVAAVVGGSAEIGFSNLISVAAAIERGIPVTIIAPATVFVARAPDIVLAKARRTALKTGADLNGKIVAVTTLDGELQMGAAVWIDKNGGSAKSVHFVELPETAMAAALMQGRIDAAMMTEPHFSQARADVDLVANADSAIAPVFISGVYFAATSWVNDHPDVARRVAQALRETAHWANTHHTETAAVLARAGDLDPATIGRMTRSTFAESLTVPEIAPALDVAYAYGRLKEPYDVRGLVTKAQAYWGK
jgi:NitT/TauT family transport system substrate-binding protein